MRTTELSVERVIGYLAAVFFTVLALYLVVMSVWVVIFFRDGDNWNWYQLWGGLIYLFYAAVFAAAAWLVVARVPRRRYWLPLAMAALPALAWIAPGGLLPRPGGYAVATGLLMVLLYAIGYATFRRRAIA